MRTASLLLASSLAAVALIALAAAPASAAPVRGVDLTNCKATLAPGSSSMLGAAPQFVDRGDDSCSWNLAGDIITITVTAGSGQRTGNERGWMPHRGPSQAVAIVGGELRSVTVWSSNGEGLQAFADLEAAWLSS